MKVIAIIQFILCSICLIALTYNAIKACLSLRREEPSLNKILMLTLISHLRSNVNQINEMKKSFADLIKHEEYEEAEKLKPFILKAEDSLKKSLHSFRKMYGDECCEVIVVDVKRNDET